LKVGAKNQVTSFEEISRSKKIFIMTSFMHRRHLPIEEKLPFSRHPPNLAMAWPPPLCTLEERLPLASQPCCATFAYPPAFIAFKRLSPDQQHAFVLDLKLAHSRANTMDGEWAVLRQHFERLCPFGTTFSTFDLCFLKDYVLEAAFLMWRSSDNTERAVIQPNARLWTMEKLEQLPTYTGPARPPSIFLCSPPIPSSGAPSPAHPPQ
jgi:hypothetical protein